MNDELKDAIAWARVEAGDGPWNEHVQEHLHTLADAAERSVELSSAINEAIADRSIGPLTITPEMVVTLLPDWAAGMACNSAGVWHSYERKPAINNQDNGWYFDGTRSAIGLCLPAPADWRESWIPKPKPELRCPWPGCDGRLFANTDDRTWWMQCDTCKCPGPIHANEAEARASVEGRR